jgi:carbon-monoxide dehydrogenase medium subunit
MTILKEFKYYKPESLKETITLLCREKNSVILAGGTDLINNLKEGSVSPDAVVDIKGISPLGEIKLKENKLKIGALVTFSDVINSEIILENFPVIAEMAKFVGSTSIRNRATLAGNICSAVPCMDNGPVLVVYDAVIHVVGLDGERSVPVSKWFKDSRKVALKKGEIVTSISIALPAEKHGGCFIKLGRYSGEDLAQVNMAVLVLPGYQYRVGFGSIAPIPIRAKKIEKVLNGKKLDDGLLRTAKKLIPEEITPITDIRATKEYRLLMSEIMFERAIKAATQRLDNSGPEYGKSLI